MGNPEPATNLARDRQVDASKVNEAHESPGSSTTEERAALPGEEGRPTARSFEKAAYKGQMFGSWDFQARGEPFIWGLGGALVVGLLMIVGFLSLILYNGILTFYPQRIEVVTLNDGGSFAGELGRKELYKPPQEDVDKLPEAA